MAFDLDLIEQEHVIGRLKTIELLEKLSRYQNLPEPVERRFSQALVGIPDRFHSAALLVFSTVIYLPRAMLDETWPSLWRSFSGGRIPIVDKEEAHFVELDRDQIRDDFYRTNKLVGRLEDNSSFSSGHNIIDALIGLERGEPNPSVLRELASISMKKYWVLLSDISLSGTSIISEMRRLSFVITKILNTVNIELLCLCQMATQDALMAIEREGLKCQAAIQIPSSFAFKDPNYNLLRSSAAKEQVEELCDWFAETHVVNSNYRIANISERKNDPRIAKYGFDGKGWSIVTYKNTPNNSLPIIWFKPPIDRVGQARYSPPFERIDSRIGESSPHRRDWIGEIESSSVRLANLQSKLTGLAS